MNNLTYYIKTRTCERETHIEFYSDGLNVFQSIAGKKCYHIERVHLNKNMMRDLRDQLNEVLNESEASEN